MRTVLSVVTVILMFAATASAQEGRWKLGGDGSCYWDATDGGPDQCAAPVAEVQQATYNLQAVAGEMADVCGMLEGDDQGICYGKAEAIATVIGGAVPETPVGVAMMMYTVYCASSELIAWMDLNEEMFSRVQPDYSGTDLTWAPMGVKVRIIQVMMSALGAVL